MGHVAKGLFFLGACLLVAGCAGKRVREELPDVVTQAPEVSAELLKQFEVSDIPIAIPTTTTSVPAPKKKKVKKKKAFTYPDRRPKADTAVRIGESLQLDVSVFGLTAGTFQLKVLPIKEVNGRSVYHVEARAKSSSLFSRFYELDDVFESFVDTEGFFSHRYQVTMDETKQYRKAFEFHDSEKKTTTYSNMRRSQDMGNEDRRDTVEIPSFPQDILSTLLFVRTFEDFSTGKKYRFPYVSEAKAMEIEFEVIRREEISTPLGDHTPCIVMRPTVWHEGQPKPGEIYLWFTEEPQRFLVRVEAHVRIGTVKAIATEIVRGGSSG